MFILVIINDFSGIYHEKEFVDMFFIFLTIVFIFNCFVFNFTIHFPISIGIEMHVYERENLKIIWNPELFIHLESYLIYTLHIGFIKSYDHNLLN
uniref:Uncharacterized protein n=1 Tax=Theileria annulata TaxID=5874 RepID=A0A3B0NFL9_THEAN